MSNPRGTLNASSPGPPIQKYPWPCRYIWMSRSSSTRAATIRSCMRRRSLLSSGRGSFTSVGRPRLEAGSVMAHGPIPSLARAYAARQSMIPPLLEAVRARVRDVPDFPRPGIVFKDLTPVLADPLLFHGVVSALAARGFILGGALAATLRRGFVPVRKPGKLPGKAHREAYGLEYGNDALELHVDALVRNARVLVVDDLLATGGTAAATDKLIRRAGGTVVGFAFLVELAELGGGDRLGSDRVVSLIRYERP